MAPTRPLGPVGRGTVPMDLNLPVPSRPVPVGVLLLMYSFAAALRERGHGVRLVHVEADGIDPTRPDQLGHLTSLDPRIEHEVIEQLTGDLSDGDAVFCFDERLGGRR